MKEKLIALQLQADLEDEVSENATEHRGYVADLMLACGVIVLPCKVGDTVWRTCKKPYLLREVKVKEVSLWVGGAWFVTDEGGKFSITHFEEADIGKTVFLTREEAEAALEEE